MHWRFELLVSEYLVYAHFFILRIIDLCKMTLDLMVLHLFLWVWLFSYEEPWFHGLCELDMFIHTFFSYDLRYDDYELYFGGFISISFWECCFLINWSCFFEMSMLVSVFLLIFMMFLGYKAVLLWIEFCGIDWMVFILCDEVWELDLLLMYGVEGFLWWILGFPFDFLWIS